MRSDEIVRAKVEQAIAILQEHQVDCWLTFAQEMGDGGDPVYPMIFGERDLGLGLLLLTRTGRKIAIVSGLDYAIPRGTGVWDEVIVHSGDLRASAIDILRSLDPAQIAINYSSRFPAADGLSHGKYLRLQRMLEGTPFLDRLTSAESIVLALRTHKLPQEVARIRSAIEQTDEIFEELRRFLRPGVTGREIYEFVLREVDRRGLETAWSRDHCPIVTVGPGATIGHTPPGDAALQAGWTLQVDFGVKHNGYCSDFQRMWYVLDRGERQPPPEVLRTFEAVRAGVDAMIDAIRPGQPTWKPAAVAQEAMISRGLPPPRFGVGHHLGRMAHDGGPGLAVRKEEDPEWLLEPGYVLTAEGLETLVEGRGWISLEEDVLVTPTGHEVLTRPQRELWLIR